MFNTWGDVPAPTETTISTLGKYTALVERKLASRKFSFFRGSGKATYRLKPTLFRHPTAATIDDLLRVESGMIGRFRQRALPYRQRQELADVWDTLFLMQHFGVPTRLLDWTENPYVAMFFALTSAHRDNAGHPTEDAAIWILDPTEWNKKALEHMTFRGDILSPHAVELDSYAKSDSTVMNKLPVALYGNHNSPRIVAQRGVFTIFGTNTEPMEIIYDNSGFPVGSLEKVVLPKGRINNLLDSTIRIGFTDSVIFPDLDGVARDIKRAFSFNTF